MIRVGANQLEVVAYRLLGCTLSVVLLSVISNTLVS